MSLSPAEGLRYFLMLHAVAATGERAAHAHPPRAPGLLLLPGLLVRPQAAALCSCNCNSTLPVPDVNIRHLSRLIMTCVAATSALQCHII
jgi:hypothetical protein